MLMMALCVVSVFADTLYRDYSGVGGSQPICRTPSDLYEYSSMNWTANSTQGLSNIQLHARDIGNQGINLTLKIYDSLSGISDNGKPQGLPLAVSNSLLSWSSGSYEDHNLTFPNVTFLKTGGERNLSLFIACSSFVGGSTAIETSSSGLEYATLPSHYQTFQSSDNLTLSQYYANRVFTSKFWIVDVLPPVTTTTTTISSSNEIGVREILSDAGHGLGEFAVGLVQGTAFVKLIFGLAVIFAMGSLFLGIAFVIKYAVNLKVKK
jgi:hypothetical protein